MTLGNMRANEVRTLIVYCGACHRDLVFNVDSYCDEVPVPAFSPRMVCTACGTINLLVGRNERACRDHLRSVMDTMCGHQLRLAWYIPCVRSTLRTM